MEELHDTREQVRLYETYDRRFSAQEKILVQRGNRLGFFDLLTGEYGQEQYELTTPPEADLPRFWFDFRITSYNVCYTKLLRLFRIRSPSASSQRK